MGCYGERRLTDCKYWTRSWISRRNGANEVKIWSLREVTTTAAMFQAVFSAEGLSLGAPTLPGRIVAE